MLSSVSNNSSFDADVDTLTPEAKITAPIFKLLSGARNSCGAAIIDSLYGQPDMKGRYVVQAVFQALQNPLSKTFVMKTIFLNKFSFNEVVQNKNGDDYMGMKKELFRWSIIKEFGVKCRACSSFNMCNICCSDDSKQYCYDVSFKDCLLLSLQRPANPFASDDEGSYGNRTTVMLSSEVEKHSSNKWDYVLRFLLGIKDSSQEPQKVIKDILVDKLRLLGITQIGSEKKLTQRGFQFMLLDFRSQILKVISQYISDAKNIDNLVENINLLCTLAYCKPYKLYDIEIIKQYYGYYSNEQVQSPNPMKFFQFLVRLGIVMGLDINSVPTEKEVKFIALTSIATNILFSDDTMTTSDMIASAQSTTASFQTNDVLIGGMKLIVETNRQVLAYVSNELHIAILDLFVDISVKLPNMIFGELRRPKIIDAYYRGITVKQIINFLEDNSHSVIDPSALSQKVSEVSKIGTSKSNSNGDVEGEPEVHVSRVPFNVREQLQLWYDEEMQFNNIQDAILVTLDPNAEMFSIKMWKDAARAKDSILWENKQDLNSLSVLIKPE